MAVTGIYRLDDSIGSGFIFTDTDLPPEHCYLIVKDRDALLKLKESAGQPPDGVPDSHGIFLPIKDD